MTARTRMLFLSLWLALSGLAPNFVRADDNARRNVELEWDGIEGATQYEVQVTSKEDTAKKPIRFKTPTPKWIANIKPGLYLMQVRAFDDRGAPGDWSPPSELLVKLPRVLMGFPKPNQAISANEQDTHELKLRWDKIPGADKYHVLVRSTNSDWKTDKEIKGDENSLALSVPVGENFTWTVTAIEAKGTAGEEQAAPSPFLVMGPHLKRPDILKPLSKYLREMKWEESPKAKSYTYELDYRDPKTKKWQKVDGQENYVETHLDLKISRPSGRYRLKVQAFGDRREPSKMAKLDFDTFGGFRDPAALETAIKRDSIVKPTNYYLIASYLITEITYQGVDHDANATASFQAIGGTGRAGVGYQAPESQWGGFGIVDLSGFLIHGQNFKFASAEAHLTHKLELGQGGLLLLGTGLFSKELPIVAGNATDGFQGVGTVRTYGPHVGFTYWTPLTERFGMQANARAYYSLFGSTQSSGKTDPALSYQYGLLGSYRINPTIMGFAGVAIRKDQAIYKSNSSDPNSAALPGQSNSIQIDGTYLNLLLEYSF